MSKEKMKDQSKITEQMMLMWQDEVPNQDQDQGEIQKETTDPQVENEGEEDGQGEGQEDPT